MTEQKPYQFHYSLTGNKNNPVILLLHGFMGNGSDFIEVIPFLAKKFYCLTVDLPGHGKTRINGGDENYTMPKTARELINLLDFLGINKCYLFGYSMGGRLALYLTVNFPRRFEKVILESASPGLNTEEERYCRISSDFLLANKLETTDFKEFLLNWYDLPLFQSLSQHPNFEKMLQRRLQNNPFELAKSLRNMGTGNQPSLWEKLPEVKIPLLLLVGEMDNKFLAINSEMARLLPEVKMQIIPDTGHNIHLENPQLWVEDIINFA
jgi:2-succinyl-6-hydroxy-2,4-cyclohexadiene-1-carboxylate synthase